VLSVWNGNLDPSGGTVVGHDDAINDRVRVRTMIM